MQKMTAKTLAFSAMLIAFATALSFLTIVKMPQGGSVSALSMLFIALIGYFYGVKVGVMAGVAYGLIQFAFGGYVVHPVQFLLDYPLAFGCLGLSGLFYKHKYGLIIGYLTGVFGRFVCSTAAGFVFFSEYAPEGQSALLYSIIYNGTYLGVEALISSIIILVPVVRTNLEKLKERAVL